MFRFELGGYYLDKNTRVQLPIKKAPSIDELTNYLNILKKYNGVLVLDNNQEHKHRPYKMVLYSDYNYLIMLETLMTNGDIEVRTFYDNSVSKEFISILGESYAKASTVTDFSLVIQVFKEFYENGNVSKDILN
ncbi:hypothetical protein RHO14_07745 [Orbus wheelerorum]|uniref:DUF6911 family protein n=1 Tax=Orbus wheelerorum TaxID=3074111 RepID=UPI00370D00D5